jgi:hypothetical protein
MTAAAHARLVALIGDAIRDGLDSARVRLPPGAERRVIERAVRHIEIARYQLVLDRGDDPVEERGRVDEERAILAERCEHLLDKWRTP